MEQDRALRVLEFTKIRELLAQNAITEEGRQRCLELTPYHDLGDVNHALAETEEAVVLLTYLGQNPLVSYPDVRESIARAQKGACLSPRMLLDISAFLRAARAARSALVRDREDTPILTGLASRLTVLERVETDINDAILSEEEIADRASAELYQIRRQIRSANERMRDKLNQMIRSSSFAKNLQDSIITMRGDRYCIPVKAECRANVPGLVHDQSASGATLFIEPMFVVELGNDLKQLYAKEQQEITRILQALSDSLAPYGEALEGNLDLLRELDFAFAKGLLGRQMRAVLPKIEKLCAAHHSLMQTVEGLKDMDSGLVKIATFSSVSAQWLPRILKSFGKVYPNIEFEVVTGDFYDQIEGWIVSGTVDCGFLRLPSVKRLQTYALHRDELQVIVPCDHPYADRDPFPVSALAEEPFIQLEEGDDYEIMAAFDEMGIRPNVKYIAREDRTILAMVSEGLGISLLPELMVRHSPTPIKVCHAPLHFYRTIGIGVKDKKALSNSTRLFVDYVRTWVTENGNT